MWVVLESMTHPESLLWELRIRLVSDFGNGRLLIVPEFF